MAKKYKMHVISGTHWDREWRYTAEQSKLRLTDLIDNLLDILEKKPSYHSFLLDGGTIILEDYLSIRPENEDRIKKLVKEKRLFLVNFYTLPDMFIVAPEALIRNLLIGQMIGERYGGCMKTGYTATSYGQISQLPQIYHKFGIDSIYFYRGLNKHVVPPIFMWESSDGSKIIVIRGFDDVTRTNWFFYVHQPLVLGKKPADLSYTFNKENLPVHFADEFSYEQDFQVLKEDMKFNQEKESLKQAVKNIWEFTNWQSIGNHLLALNMEDNQKPFELLPEMVSEMNQVSEDIEIIQNDWDSFIREVKKDISEKDMKIFRGEMRYTAVEQGFNGLLGAVLSSRINLKLLNEKAETQLIYLAEPLATFAYLLGYEYPYLNLHIAWKSLLQNHAHDSINGAAVEQAHKDMLYRFSHAQMVAEEVTRRAFEKIWQNIDFSGFKDNDFMLTLFNTLPYRRKEIVKAIIDLPENQKIKYFDLIDLNGNKFDYEILSREAIQMRIERELDTSIKFNSERIVIIFETEIPGMGYTSLAIRPRNPEYAKEPQPDYKKFIASPEGILENIFLKIIINPNGTLNVIDKENKIEYSNLHYFTDTGEVGSAHHTVEPLRNFTVTSLGNYARIILKENSYLRGIFQIELDMKIPAEVTFDRKDRVTELLDLKIVYQVILEKDSKKVKFKTEITNKSRDHKLRVLFPTGIKTDFVCAESSFKIEKRSILSKNTKDNIEKHFPYQPMQNFVDVSDNQKGIAFFSKGLREYEVINDEKRTLAITLLRTHRAYMTANEIMTPEELSNYESLHQIGKMKYEYALYFHRGDWDAGNVLREAYEFKVPVKIIQGVKNNGKLPPESSFFEISPEKVVLSTIKRREKGEGILIRVWNPYNHSFNLKIKSKFKFTKVIRVSLNEKEIEEYKFNNDIFEIPINKYEILSLIVESPGLYSLLTEKYPDAVD